MLYNTINYMKMIQDDPETVGIYVWFYFCLGLHLYDSVLFYFDFSACLVKGMESNKVYLVK